jgi:AraC-like DNA-binding protein
MVAGVGRVLLWRGGSLWIGHSAGSVDVHAHHAIQMSLALTGRLKLRSAGAAWSEYRGAIVHPHHRHQFDGCGESVAQLFVEPETVQGQALLQAHSTGGIDTLPDEIVSPVVASLRNRYAAHAADEVLIASGHDAIAALAGSASRPAAVDPRVTRVIDWLQGRLGAPVTLAEAARVAHLSPSRFRHLFMAQTGVSFRAYLLWLRLAPAVGAAMGGRPWTEAAQEWGFADSAHLSRTCRRMFGIAPTMLLREAEPSRRR